MKNHKGVLFLIVVSQFFCTSLWFAGNGVLDNLVADFSLEPGALGHLTASVQFGFICGTLLFALLALSDRYSPSLVFFLSAMAAGTFNLSLLWEGNTLYSLMASRFSTGFFLAGIYPVGMKIAADYFEKGLGRSLSFLVGALVLGTALPHLLKSNALFTSWNWVVLSTSVLSFLGGILIYAFIPNGPFRTASSRFDLMAVFSIFKNKKLRSAAFGYFGHMWELYAFWAFVPMLLKTYENISKTPIAISFWSFLIIGVGSLGCIIGGLLSEKIGVTRTAFSALLISCLCCLLSPVFFYMESEVLFMSFLLLWGMAVIADSPLFSTLVANNAEGSLKGSALTLVNCIGFSITIFSIQLLNYLQFNFPSTLFYPILAVGPLAGLWALRKNRTSSGVV
jgi:predicted MFS family arabinose efflux permease